MSKDFITIDVREPEYKVVREAFEAWESEGYFQVEPERNIGWEEIKYTLFKLGFGDMVDDGK
jgi:hypothetical protein